MLQTLKFRVSQLVDLNRSRMKAIAFTVTQVLRRQLKENYSQSYPQSYIQSCSIPFANQLDVAIKLHDRSRLRPGGSCVRSYELGRYQWLSMASYHLHTINGISTSPFVVRDQWPSSYCIKSAGSHNWPLCGARLDAGGYQL